MSYTPKDRYEQDPRKIYADIIDLPHHESQKHPHMSLYDRAAQFSPFAALTGYEDMVLEEARETRTKTEIAENGSEEIDRRLSEIADQLSKGIHPVAEITYFVPDEKKSGGEYVTVKEEIKRIDAAFRKLILVRTEGAGKVNASIDIGSIICIMISPTKAG